MDHLNPAYGPHVVAIGGGTGLSNLLRGLKLYTKNITAIVTVSDDGGGSGALRRDLGMVAPGDIRNCLVALANAEPMMTDLMNFRFSDGSLAGQSFGNLFLAALNGISPSFDQAVSAMSQVLAITGCVLPVTNEDMRLEAEFENGTVVQGECSITAYEKTLCSRIRRIHLLPGDAQALPAAVEAINNADMIVLAPGSLYTSIIPNLLVGGITEAIGQSDVLKVGVCNIMTQPGETEGYTVADHLQAIFQHSNRGLMDVCLVNSAPIPEQIRQLYAQKNSTPVLLDADRCRAMGIEILHRPVAQVVNNRIRHNPGHLARELILLHAERSIRIAGVPSKHRFRQE
jgi:uncharacterized cofD-like protein